MDMYMIRRKVFHKHNFQFPTVKLIMSPKMKNSLYSMTCLKRSLKKKTKNLFSRLIIA